MINHHWADAAQQCQQRGDAYALITILGCSGSTPGDQGSKMVVTVDQTFDTIGGGNLEFTLTNKARALLSKNTTTQEVIPLPLGGELGQCCGGNATVLIETFEACPFQIALFGAGHVAKALVTILGGLPCKVRWIDNRATLFPSNIPTNVLVEKADNPVELVTALPENSDILIITHNHQLDYELTAAALNHGKFRHIGLIGSTTKAQRFQQRLLKAGFNAEQIAAISCPIGLSEVPGKLPMEIAVSIAGELIALEHKDEKRTTHRGLAWKDLKQTLKSGTSQDV